MSARALQTALSFLFRLWPAGPIFTKELRVSSRRRRNFALRFVYLAILTLFIGLMWMEVVGRYDFDSGSSAYRASRMSDAGKVIVVCVVCFQFAAANVLGVILLSNAISDEVVHRTLGVLMCTPISSFQIVLGKLLSKMLQLILLLAISLPLLAVVRVFGGVPWDYVVAGLCMTLAWALFSASVSLLLSVYSRRAYVVIFACGVIGGILYLLIPWPRCARD